MKYSRFFTMIATSTAVMLGLMYLNSYSILEHAFWSETRFYMTLVMGAAMTAVMLSFMLGMYTNKTLNTGIYIGSALVVMVALFLVRSQITVGDTSYMSAMIPHHSIAILTSERSGIEDVRVRNLADGIIKAQRKEIKEMEWLMNDIKTNGKTKTQAEAQQRPVPPFTGRVTGDPL